jgi:hexosaminidase
MDVRVRALAAVAAFGVLSSCAQPPLHEAAALRTPTPRITVAAPATQSTVAAPAISIVPQPRSLRVESGTYVWPAAARIAVNHPGGRNVAEQLRAFFARNGVATSMAARGAPADIELQDLRGRGDQLGNEGYVLRVRRDGVTIGANAGPGLFYALQTLDQISTRSGRRLVTRLAAVVDRPEYRWRGIHLDVARHFFPVSTVKRYIDVAAHYKLNVFHWHLTDDQAWRLQSARYPALTAGRDAYSAADVRDIVAYAARRYVTVVPEIEMPAHASAALRAYPRLACGPALCATGAGLDFARNVLAEVIALFPSSYVHAGGDEVLLPALSTQPAFTREIGRSIESHGRRLIVWDDVFTPELSRRATVMVWTGHSRAAQIARHGNDVVVTSAPLYFDAAQGDPAQEPPATRHMSTLEQVYTSGVLPAGLRGEDAAHVIGAQANVWTERIATPDHLFRMALPRELALAEIAWTPRAKKSWSSFLARLPAQLAWLETHGYPFRIPNAAFAFTGGPASFEAVPGHVQSVAVRTTAPELTVSLSVPLTRSVVRYTLDGGAPSAMSPRYRGPFTIRTGRVPLRLRAAAFLAGRTGAVTESTVTRVVPAEMRGRAHGSTSWAALVSP